MEQNRSPISFFRFVQEIGEVVRTFFRSALTVALLNILPTSPCRMARKKSQRSREQFVDVLDLRVMKDIAEVVRVFLQESQEQVVKAIPPERPPERMVEQMEEVAKVISEQIREISNERISDRTWEQFVNKPASRVMKEIFEVARVGFSQEVMGERGYEVEIVKVVQAVRSAFTCRTSRLRLLSAFPHRCLRCR